LYFFFFSFLCHFVKIPYLYVNMIIRYSFLEMFENIESIHVTIFWLLSRYPGCICIFYAFWSCMFIMFQYMVTNCILVNVYSCHMKMLYDCLNGNFMYFLWTWQKMLRYFLWSCNVHIYFIWTKWNLFLVNFNFHKFLVNILASCLSS
jgi:hypothetical protein